MLDIGYSTDIRENLRFSQDSVQTNNDLTVVQPDLGAESTCPRHSSSLTNVVNTIRRQEGLFWFELLQQLACDYSIHLFVLVQPVTTSDTGTTQKKRSFKFNRKSVIFLSILYIFPTEYSQNDRVFCRI